MDWNMRWIITGEAREQRLEIREFKRQEPARRETDQVHHQASEESILKIEPVRNRACG
jgi:hypothetical protein